MRLQYAVYREVAEDHPGFGFRVPWLGFGPDEVRQFFLDLGEQLVRHGLLRPKVFLSQKAPTFNDYNVAPDLGTLGFYNDTGAGRNERVMPLCLFPGAGNHLHWFVGIITVVYAEAAGRFFNDVFKRYEKDLPAECGGFVVGDLENENGRAWLAQHPDYVQLFFDERILPGCRSG